MVKIFNPVSGPSPLGQTLASFGKSMFGDQTSNALNNEKLYAAQRENTETDNLMKRVGGAGAQTLGADPIAQAMMLASGIDPKAFGAMGLMGAANAFGAKDARTQNWQVGVGQAYDNTADAFGSKLAETARNNDLASSDRRYNVDQSIGQQRYEFDRKPMAVLGSDNVPTFAPQGGVVGSGMSPVLSNTETQGTLARQNFGRMGELPVPEQEYLGALPGSAGGSRAPKNYIAGDKVYMTTDGITDAQSGQPLPPGGYIGTVQGGAGDVGLSNSTLSGVQQNVIANNKFQNLVNMTREAAMKDANNFGIPGMVKGAAQDARQLAGTMANGLGFTSIEEAVQATAQDAMRAGIDPNLLTGVFDPSLSELQTLGDLMVYSAAEALAGQSGRSVSDKDVQFFKGIVGDPSGWLMNQEKYLAKLGQIERLIQMNQTEMGQALTNGAQPRGGPQPGMVEDGYRFKGGDPANPTSWEPVQ